MDAVIPLQGLPSLVQILSALIVVAVVIVIGRVLLNVAFKIVAAAAVVVGILWLLGSFGGVIPIAAAPLPFA